jgi:putative hydrolase of the HAD superfamily
MTVKQIIFDLGGVLIEWGPQKIVESFSSDKTLQEKVLKEILQHPDWLELDRGSFTESEAVQKISARSELTASTIRDVFTTVRRSFIAIDETVALLKQLVEQGIPCYALSNMSSENYTFLLKTHNFLEYFSGIVISGQEKLIKPDLALYQLMCERYALQPAETLFIDDMLANCQAAETLGMEVLHFKREQFSGTDIQRYLTGISLDVFASS